MIPKWEHKQTENGPAVPKMTVERYLGYYEAQNFFHWLKKTADLYLIEDVNAYLDFKSCRAEAPNQDAHRGHIYEFGYVANEDHGDEVWFCKYCHKRQTREGPDA